MKPSKPKQQRKKKQSSSKSPIIIPQREQNDISVQDGANTPISTISNDPFATAQSMVNVEAHPLYRYHRDSIMLKHKIIRALVFTFYSIEEYALINYICCAIEDKFRNQVGFLLTSEKYKNRENRAETDLEELLTVKKDQIIQKFYDASKNIQTFKQIRMIMDKQKDVGFIKINSSFFNMLSSIFEDLSKKISQNEKQYTQVQRLICKNCGAKRQLWSVQSKVSCDCGSKETINQKDKTEAINTINILSQQIKLIKSYKAELDDLKKKQSQRIVFERNKNYESHRVTDVHDEVLQATKIVQRQGNQFLSPWSKFPLKKTGHSMKQAEKQFAPKRKYQKIVQLGMARKRRKVEKPIELM